MKIEDYKSRTNKKISPKIFTISTIVIVIIFIISFGYLGMYKNIDSDYNSKKVVEINNTNDALSAFYKNIVNDKDADNIEVNQVIDAPYTIYKINGKHGSKINGMIVKTDSKVHMYLDDNEYIDDIEDYLSKQDDNYDKNKYDLIDIEKIRDGEDFLILYTYSNVDSDFSDKGYVVLNQNAIAIDVSGYIELNNRILSVRGTMVTTAIVITLMFIFLIVALKSTFKNKSILLIVLLSILVFLTQRQLDYFTNSLINTRTMDTVILNEDEKEKAQGILESLYTIDNDSIVVDEIYEGEYDKYLIQGGNFLNRKQESILIFTDKSDNKHILLNDLNLDNKELSDIDKYIQDNNKKLINKSTDTGFLLTTNKNDKEYNFIMHHNGKAVIRDSKDNIDKHLFKLNIYNKLSYLSFVLMFMLALYLEYDTNHFNTKELNKNEIKTRG